MIRKVNNKGVNPMRKPSPFVEEVETRVVETEAVEETERGTEAVECNKGEIEKEPLVSSNPEQLLNYSDSLISRVDNSIIDDSGSIVNSKSDEIVEDLAENDELELRSNRSKIIESNDRYLLEDKDGKIVEATKFKIKPLYSITDGETTTAYVVEVIHSDGVSKKIELTPLEISSKVKLTLALDTKVCGISHSIKISNASYSYFKDHCFSNFNEIIAIQEAGGIKEVDGEYKLITKDGALNKYGDMDTSLRSKNQTRLLFSSDLSEEGKDLSGLVVRDNAFLIGYAGSVLIKEQLKDIGYGFPCLSLRINKTKDYDNIIPNFLGCSRAEPVSSTGYAEKSRLLDKASLNNASVVALEMVNALRDTAMFESLVKSSFSCLERSSKTVESPVVILNDTSTDYNDNEVLTYTVKNGCSNLVKDYVSSLGKETLYQSLRTSLSDIKSLVNTNKALIFSTDLGNIEEAEGLSIVLSGLDIINKVLNLSDIDTIKRDLIKEFIKDNNFAGDKAYEVLKLVNDGIISGQLVDIQHYRLNNDGTMHFDFCRIFETLKVQERFKLTLSNFYGLIEHKEWNLGTKRPTINKSKRRFKEIDLNKLKENYNLDF